MFEQRRKLRWNRDMRTNKTIKETQKLPQNQKNICLHFSLLICFYWYKEKSVNVENRREKRDAILRW